ncbi:MAG: polysaccharide biosynthesis protein GtrA [SAR86 cluster bacterium]|uniref:Polysaccharide biosynthesis protein GtrA n=1 Tax=SAR86 cluster bacterium TaxID=2030880 RepID=A0A2A4MSK9_9GAMM|nr:MAG: polysaccharide biosynthesis protein GtrA [SAR86 cluster bacterium]
MPLAFKYAIFALLATIINLLSQELSLQFLNGDHDIVIAMMVGTFTGLVAKYSLDKQYIFAYTSKTQFDNSKKFVLYSLTGVFTTVLFWGFEFGFDSLFDSKTARYIGAIIGLALGYAIKYRLDSHYVFKS